MLSVLGKSVALDEGQLTIITRHELAKHELIQIVIRWRCFGLSHSNKAVSANVSGPDKSDACLRQHYGAAFCWRRWTRLRYQ